VSVRRTFGVSVLDAARRVEVAGLVEARVVVLRVRGAGAPRAGAREVRHVVDDRVHVDTDADGGATAHHVLELRGGARAAPREGVAHRLVALAPILGRDDAVFVRRRHLHRMDARGAEDRLALRGDVVPAPVEEVHVRVARGRHPGGAVFARYRRAYLRLDRIGVGERERLGARAGQRERERDEREGTEATQDGRHQRGGWGELSSGGRPWFARTIAALRRSPSSLARDIAESRVISR